VNTEISWGNLLENIYLEDHKGDERIILRWMWRR